MSLATDTTSAILSNSIFSNTGLGIDLDPNGVTPNDAGDGDTGPNNLQNFPVLNSSITTGSVIRIRGNLDSAASTDFRIELFENDSCDASGNGEGETFLGATTATTNGAGIAGFDAILTKAVAAGQLITATATDPDNNTSEFSACQTATATASVPGISWQALVGLAALLAVASAWGVYRTRRVAA